MISEVKKKGSRPFKKPSPPLLDRKLWDEFFGGSRLACARLITIVENHPELIPRVRHRLIPRLNGAVRVGITGPPGVGKSTVTAALARRAAGLGHSVGIIAVDPTSPFTGGAFLGDRVRMQDLSGDGRIFIRSLASREGHGGLSPATPHAADILDAFGLDRIFIETAELDVLACADLLVLVMQPGTGDGIQALKAGILEAADMFLVNKADLPGTEMLLDSLRFLFEIGPRPDPGDRPPILAASAIRDSGMDEAYAAVEDLVGGLIRSGRFHRKRCSLLAGEIRASVRRDLWERFLSLTDAGRDIPAAAERLIRSRRSPYPYIRRLCSRVRIQPKKQRTSRGQRS
jgi:LAO/AO transport system kinase